MALIPSPRAAEYSKTFAGISNTSVQDNVIKFMGCSVLSINCTLGFNGTPASVSLTLVEDTESGDSFTTPIIPSIWSFTLPRGGLNVPIFFDNSTNFDPDGFFPANTPFHFCGICTNFQKVLRDTGGRTINVTLVDPREILSGVQCLLGGFALSQNLNGTDPRFEDVENVIDVFGYYDYGMTSGKNEYGMQWSKIVEAIEAVQVKVQELKFEFLFTGEAFTDAPEFYRIDDSIIDIIGLCQRVCNDSGSDFVAIARKTADSEGAVIELRSIRRENNNPLTQSEIQEFIDDRSEIVRSAKVGREFRNEPNSSVIIGGMRNSNYLALPASYVEEMHGIDNGTYFEEDYNVFPSDIKTRLFGGTATIFNTTAEGSGITVSTTDYEVDSGAIYPFWGLSPDDHAYPFIEPFLPLDHLVIDKDTDEYANLIERVPSCKISIEDFQVRAQAHSDVFIDGDGDSDNRPFAYIEEYTFSNSAQASGYVRGLPLNTESLRAALTQNPETFFNIYATHYPDIAQNLGIPLPNFKELREKTEKASGKINLENEYEYAAISKVNWYEDPIESISPPSVNADGSLSDPAYLDNTLKTLKAQNSILIEFHKIIFSHVYEYAQENIGKRFLVCLPKSQIMQRIWSGLPVPTNPNKPEIEYIVSDRGYWENVPSELNGIVNSSSSTFTIDQENQIRRKFMAEDGRFLPMAIIDWKPQGNINFNSNGYNKAMFQDLSVNDFRPNRIAEGNPPFVFTSCSVNTLAKRPDLALVELPSAIRFDPPREIEMKDSTAALNDEFLAEASGVIKYLWFLYRRNEDLRAALKIAATQAGESLSDYSRKIFAKWSFRLIEKFSQGARLDLSLEYVMDLKGVVIPLTSTWMSYGPYYADYSSAKGMRKIEVDPNLVPWNFERPTFPDPWYTNLDAAGQERLERSICEIDYVDTAVISVAGFPEMGPADPLGFNSNLTSITVDFAIGGVETTYSLSTYSAKPGTYRKSEYDDVTKARIDTREKQRDPLNTHIVYDLFSGRTGEKNIFRN